MNLYNLSMELNSTQALLKESKEYKSKVKNYKGSE